MDKDNIFYIIKKNLYIDMEGVNKYFFKDDFKFIFYI